MMTRPLSLQRRLFLALMILMGSVWLVMLIVLWFATRHEVDELLDAHLAQTGNLLASHYTALTGETRPASRWVPNEYQSHVVFQVWSGEERIAASLHAPATALAPPGSQGYTERQLGLDTWRVFSLTPEDSGVTVMVAETHTIRDDIIDASMIGAVLPVLLGLPVMMFGLWATVRSSLSPLRQLSAALESRPAQAMTPLDTQDMPREIQPLLSALNGLLARMGAMLASEQRFTADAAHELRTPLAAIRMQVQVAMGAGDEGRGEALQSALAGCDRAAHLMDQLLQLARLDATADAAETMAQTSELPQITDMLWPMLSRQAEARGQTLELEQAPDLPAVSMPPALVEAMLRNVLDNALRYSPQGGVVALAVSMQGAWLEVRVEDSGPGMNEDSLSRLGERFFRELGTGQPGSGLGWSIVRAIARRHRVDVQVARSERLGGLAVVMRFKPV